MYRSIRVSTLLIIIGCFFSSQAYSANSMIEYSKMINSNTLSDVNTLGFYTIFERDEYFQYYAGIDFALFQPETAINGHMSTRVAIGISGLGAFAPFADVGTGLFDILFRGSSNTQNCNQVNGCEPQLFFRAGMRIGITKHVTLGAYYEGVSFGNTQTVLTGSHGYTAASIGVQY